MMLSTAIAIFLPTLLGFLIITIILRNDKETFFGERIGLSFPLGAGILTLQIFLLGLMRIPLTLFNSLMPVFFELMLLSFWIWKNKIVLIPSISDPGLSLFLEIKSPRNHGLKKCLFALLIIWIIAKLVSVFILTGLRPIFAWDAWANWSAGAKIFFYSKSLLLDAPALEFFGGNAVDRILYYPLHNTLLQLWMSLWMGKFDDVFVKFFSPVYCLSMIICLYYIAIREIGKLYALALLAIFLSSPLLSYHSIEMYSDQMLGVYLLFASLSFLKAMRQNLSFCILAGAYATIAVFTKNEALFFVLPFLLSAIVYFRHDLNKSRGKYVNLISILAPFLALLPWFLFKVHYGLGFLGQLRWLRWSHELYFEYYAHSPDTSLWSFFQPDMILVYIYKMISLDNFNVIFLFFPLIILAHGKISKELLHLLVPIAGYMLFFLFLYIFTAYYMGQSMCLTRNILTFYPLFFFLTILLLKKDDTVLSYPAPITR